jgi:hypothetical protein
MSGDDFRFWAPETAEDELALVRARVRERRAGLKLTGTFVGASAAGASAVAVGARLGSAVADRWLTLFVILAFIAGATFVIVVGSAMIWSARLRRLSPAARFSDRHLQREAEPGGGARGHLKSHTSPN